MANVRLSALDRDFYSLLIRQSDETLRALALAACKYAVEKVGLKYPAIDTILRSLTDRKPLDPAEFSELGKLVAALDAIQRDILEREKLGRKTAQERKVASSQARAVNAVYLVAANEDPLYAALEAIYEAYVATDDWPALKSALLVKIQK